MGPARRLLLSTLLAPAVLLLAPALEVGAHPPPAPEPGGEQQATLTLRNTGQRTAKMRARVRLGGHGFWSTRSDARWRGPWVYTERVELAPGESREFSVAIPVPPDAPPVLIQQRQESRGRGWRWRDGGGIPLLVGSRARSSRGAGEPVPFRVFAGGRRDSFNGYEYAYDDDDHPVLARAARDDAGWTDLRLRLGFLSPDPWGLEPSVSGTEDYHDDQLVNFATAQPPDLADETILAVASPLEQLYENATHLGIHSVETLDDGTILCTYSYRLRGRPNPRYAYPGVLDSGRWILVAIPRTDAPIAFRRVR